MENQKNILQIIEWLKQQIYMLGANDVEFSIVDGIIKQYKEGQISGDEAVKKVTFILESKQNYH